MRPLAVIQSGSTELDRCLLGMSISKLGASVTSSSGFHRTFIMSRRIGSERNGRAPVRSDVSPTVCLLSAYFPDSGWISGWIDLPDLEGFRCHCFISSFACRSIRGDWTRVETLRYHYSKNVAYSCPQEWVSVSPGYIVLVPRSRLHFSGG